MPKAKEIMGVGTLASKLACQLVSAREPLLFDEVEAQKAAMAYKHHQEAKTKAGEINADTINKDRSTFNSCIQWRLHVLCSGRWETCHDFWHSSPSTRLGA